VYKQQQTTNCAHWEICAYHSNCSHWCSLGTGGTNTLIVSLISAQFESTRVGYYKTDFPQGLPFSIPHMVVIRPALSYFPLVHQTITLVAILIVWIQPLSSSECSKRSHSESEAYNEYHTISSGNRIVRCSALKGKQLVSGSKNGFTSVQVIDSLLPKNNLVNTPKNSKGKESRLPFLAEGGHQDVFTCSLLINCVLVILLLIQVTTTGITPAIVMIPYVIISILNLSVHASGQGKVEINSLIGFA